MSDAPPLRPADPDDIAEALAFALMDRGRKRVHDGDRMMAQMAAQGLVEHLRRSGFW